MQNAHRRYSRGVKAFTAIVLTILAGCGTALGAAGPARQAFDLEMPVPPTPVTIAGTLRLVYELHLTNFARVPLRVQRVEVLDANSESVIADLRGETLIGGFEQIDGIPADSGGREITPRTRDVLYFDIELKGAAAPRELEHRITYQAVAEDAPPPVVLRAAHVQVLREPPVTIAQPLRGGPWAAIYHPSWERGHRRYVYATDGIARIPGRYAVDWVLLDQEGHRARGDADEIANWYGYGADVLAVADGVVAAMRDDVSESATLSGHPQLPLEDATGNYVALRLENGLFVFYEHLKPGSIRVREGDRVRRGEAIGAIGFTGHSMGPHLHFHLADANSPLGAEGMPFVIDAFDVLGSYGGFDSIKDVPWTPFDEAAESHRTEEMPGPNVVVDFGQDPSSEP